MRTSSVMRVSPDNAIRLAAVYASVRILAETMASLPFVLYRQRADGGKDKVTDHWLYRLLAKRPNQFQNPYEWREMLQGHLALRGNAYNRIVANNHGEILELVPIHPDRIKMELTPGGDYRYRVTDRLGAEALAQNMVDGVATFDDIVRKMLRDAKAGAKSGASRLARAQQALKIAT